MQFADGEAAPPPVSADEWMRAAGLQRAGLGDVSGSVSGVMRSD